MSLSFNMLIIWSSIVISAIVTGRNSQAIGFDLLMVALFFELHFKPLRTRIIQWLELHKERAQRRREYELFKRGVKSGLYVDEQVERENRRIVK